MPLAITQPPLQLEIAGKSPSVAAAGTIKGKRFDSISGRVHRNRIDAQHTKGKTVKTGMQHAGRQVRLL